MNASPWPMRRRCLKRTLDLSLAGLLLLILALPLALIALVVRWTSPGPALFRQERMGCGGRTFRIFKFRTMFEGAPSSGPSITASGDPRVTRLGRWLRRTKIDELPQLLNVLLGDMSLVGPRPEVPRYLAAYSPENLVVLSVRPGITDPASIAFRNEERLLSQYDDTERAYMEVLLPRKLVLAREYVREQSFLRDIRILVATAGVLITQKGQGS